MLKAPWLNPRDYILLDIHPLNKTLMVFPPKEPLVYKAVPPNAAFHGRDPSCSFPWNTSSQALIN